MKEKVVFTCTREYAGIGLRHDGDVEEIDSTLTKQLKAQKFVKAYDSGDKDKFVNTSEDTETVQTPARKIKKHN